ncbi:MAG: hypothetical protein M3P14_02885 [Chloroflexota bacterium]|nr:hypothetical protein [Chloroflexota bacterium]
MQRVTHPPWEKPGWFQVISGWVVSELIAAGLPPEGRPILVRTRPWAAIARVRTGVGDVWFKESAPSLAFEPALTVHIASRQPDFSPEIIATKGPRMLTLDAGAQLRALYRRRSRAPSWDDILPRYAELQIKLAPDVPRLLGLRVPDKRPATVSTRYPDLVERFGGHANVYEGGKPKEERDAQVAAQLLLLSPRLDSLAQALQDPLPMTVIHEEVHEANIFVRDGRARLLDWGEAAVSHPFAGVVNTFRDVAFRRRLRHDGRELKRLRAIYLEPWTRFAPARQLEVLFDAGYLLGMLCRVLAWDALTQGQAPEVRQEYVHNAEVWLDMFRESFEEGVRLGGP